MVIVILRVIGLHKLLPGYCECTDVSVVVWKFRSRVIVDMLCFGGVWFVIDEFTTVCYIDIETSINYVLSFL